MAKHKKKDKQSKSDVDSEAVAETKPKVARAEKRQERRRVVNEDLQLELSTLRQTLNEMIDRFKLKVDAELVQLADATSGNGAGPAPRQLSVGVAEAMLKEIRALDVKAHKGRAKDFQRVQELVGSLIERLPAEK
jgi:hypothetical protein